MRTSSGTTARSWNSSTPMTRRPCSLSSSSRSAISLTDDRRRAHRQRAAERDRALPAEPPGAAGARANRPGQQGVADDRGEDRQHDLARAEAEDQLSHAAQLRQVELEADHEHQEDDAELGQVARRRLASPDERQRVRADAARRRRDSRGSAAGEQAGRATTPTTAASRKSSVSSSEEAIRACNRTIGVNPRIGRSYWTHSQTRCQLILPSTPIASARARAGDARHRGARLEGLKARQGDGFVAAMRAMLDCRGRVVVMGMGKSGHVGRKVAATLASTGTPAFFVHPGEASHGDLGMVTAGRCRARHLELRRERRDRRHRAGASSASARRWSTMTGRADSSLARHADIVLVERGRPGGLPAQPRADGQHHGADGARRRAGRRPARRARLSRGRLRALAPRRQPRPQAPHACGRPDAPGRRRAARRRRRAGAGHAARDDEQGLRLHRGGRRRRPHRRHLHRRRPAPPDRDRRRPAPPFARTTSCTPARS